MFVHIYIYVRKPVIYIYMHTYIYIIYMYIMHIYIIHMHTHISIYINIYTHADTGGRLFTGLGYALPYRVQLQKSTGQWFVPAETCQDCVLGPSELKV